LNTRDALKQFPAFSDDKIQAQAKEEVEKQEGVRSIFII
jgi:hypothetical protein